MFLEGSSSLINLTNRSTVSLFGAEIANPLIGSMSSWVFAKRLRQKAVNTKSSFFILYYSLRRIFILDNSAEKPIMAKAQTIDPETASQGISACL